MPRKFIAAVTIKTKPDTVRVPVKEVIPSTVLPDGTRKAELTDTTALGYIVTVKAEIPLAPANPKLGYSFIVPSFEPQVGFVKIGNSYAAVVRWKDQSFTLENAFVVPAERRDPNWNLYASVGGSYSTTEKTYGSPTAALNLDRKVGKGSFTVSGAANLAGDRGIAVRYNRSLWSR
jgi:hypothetical protein